MRKSSSGAVQVQTVVVVAVQRLRLDLRLCQFWRAGLSPAPQVRWTSTAVPPKLNSTPPFASLPERHSSENLKCSASESIWPKRRWLQQCPVHPWWPVHYSLERRFYFKKLFRIFEMVIKLFQEFQVVVGTMNCENKITTRYDTEKMDIACFFFKKKILFEFSFILISLNKNRTLLFSNWLSSHPLWVVVLLSLYIWLLTGNRERGWWSCSCKFHSWLIQSLDIS